MQVQSLASLSGLRIGHCHELWCRSQTRLRSHVAVAGASSYSPNLTPGLGTSICCRCGPKKQKAKKKKKKKEAQQKGLWSQWGTAPFVVFFVCCFFFCLFAFSRAAPAARGGSQARGRIRAFAAGLC